MTEEKEGDTVEGVVAILGCLGTPLWMYWSGFVGMKLWQWFLVPLGARPISIVSAIGISLVVHFFTYRHIQQQLKAADVVAGYVALPGLYLLIGYVIHHWFM